MLETVMNVTIVIFMVGNLLEVGLRLNVTEALRRPAGRQPRSPLEAEDASTFHGL